MAERNHHVIERQILELDVASVARAPEVQEAAAQRLRARAMAEIEVLFDRLAGPGRVVRLERVEVDLGDLRGADWQEQFESRFVERMTHALEQAAASAHAAPTSGTAFEQYLFFLRHGRLPWWGGAPGPDWPQGLLRALDAPQWRALAAVLERDTHAQRRLIQAFDDATLAALLDRHAGLPEIARVLELWRPAELPQTSYGRWRLQFWLAVLDAHADATAEEHAPGVAVMRRLLELRDAFAAPVPPAGAPPPRAAHTTPELPTPWRDWLAAARRYRGTPPGETSTPDEPARRDDASGRESPPAQTAVGLPAAPPARGAPSSGAQNDDVYRALEPPARARAAPQEGEAIYLTGAGCVILHPFLEELFRTNDLLAGRAFRSAAARERAVRLLAFLTFGDELAPEYDLLLPKLLCGMAWEEALAPIELTEAERSACEELLRSVLVHWRALKSNSTDWMREQFFLRAARLERLDLDWRLTVERQAQDVLLDRLPWGLGVIGLPWMHERIFVQWMK